MKVLKPGHKSIHDDSFWEPGVWREIADAPIDGEPCGIGFHSLLVTDPLKAPVFCWPCEVWEDEVEGECGRDLIKGRYRKQRIMEEKTNDFSVIVEIHKFL